LLCLLVLGLQTSTALAGTDPDPTNPNGTAPADPFVNSTNPTPPPPPAPDPNLAPVVVDQTPAPVIVVQQPMQGVAQRPARRLPYRAGEPIPPGYQLTRRSRPGLWIPGMIMLVVPWAISAAAASESSDGRLDDLYIPVLGPFLTMNDANDWARSPLLIDGLVQVAGVTMFILGLTLKRQYLVYMGGTHGRYFAANPTLGGVQLEARF